jgi:hypothetical protein
LSGFVPARDAPKDNAVKQEMIQLSVNPYDARKWLEDCCETGCLIGRRDPDTLQWVPWVAGEELPFSVLHNAYVEWQKTVKSRVAPEPTPAVVLGKVLTNVGCRSRRTRIRNVEDASRFRTLPPKNLHPYILKERKRDIRWLSMYVEYSPLSACSYMPTCRWEDRRRHATAWGGGNGARMTAQSPLAKWTGSAAPANTPMTVMSSAFLIGVLKWVGSADSRETGDAPDRRGADADELREVVCALACLRGAR